MPFCLWDVQRGSRRPAPAKGPEWKFHPRHALGVGQRKDGLLEPKWDNSRSQGPLQLTAKGC